jgi:ribose transport system substrate-binding protein
MRDREPQWPFERLPTRRQVVGKGLTLSALAAFGPLLAACGDDDEPEASGGRGPRPSGLEPWDPDAPAGGTPDLPRRIAWANTAPAEFLLSITQGLEIAAGDVDLEFLTAIANGDSKRNIDQMESFLQRGVAALCVMPLDAEAQTTVMQRALEDGIAVMTQVIPPSTVQVTARQYDIGRTQGRAAVKYVEENMGGEAKVVYFNTDSIAAIRPRKKGVFDALKAGGDGIEVVADQEPSDQTQEAAAQTMNTILQSQPDFNVVLGGDVYCLGALSAIEAAGRTDQVEYVSGIDGESQAINAVREGGPYKATFAFAMEGIGYSWGQFAARWLDGLTIPKQIDVKAIELNSPETIDEFQSAMENIADTWDRRPDYIQYLGNINYDSRRDYVRKPL